MLGHNIFCYTVAVLISKSPSNKGTELVKAIIIARVSTEEQKEAGLSLPAQVNRLERYCENKGFPIIKSFSFDESAYKDERGEFNRIFNFIILQKEKIAI